MYKYAIAFLLLLGASAPPPASILPQALAPAAAPAWTNADAAALLETVEGIGADGLDPADYEPAGLRAAIAGGDAAALDQAAARIFLRLAEDLADGHVGAAGRLAWHVEKAPDDPAALRALMGQALAAHRVGEALTGLLPANSEYRALKAKLAATPAGDRAEARRLRINLERWRWMPRDLGPRYILANVPAFELQLVENGRTIARHRLIVGKTRTPTPQFSTAATGLILNPWWDVPQSIIAESVGRLVRTDPAAARARGYVWSGGKVRQSPGPGNALGQMKLIMPNPFTIYVHDTPSKALFDEEERAFSHGCIRTKEPFALAEALLSSTPGWDRAAIDRIVASGTTTTVRFDRPLPVYVGYFTAATDETGNVKTYRDIYRRDEAVAAQLADREERR